MPYPPGYRHPTFRPEGMPWVEETWLPDLERPFVERTEPLPSPWTFHCDPEIIAAAELQSMERQLDVLRNRHIPKTSVSTTYGRGVKITKKVELKPGCIPGTSIPLSRLKGPQGVKKDDTKRIILPTGRAARFMRNDDSEPGPFNSYKQFAEIQQHIRQTSDNRDFSNRSIKQHWEKRLKMKNTEPLIEYFNVDGSQVIVPPPLGAKPSSECEAQPSKSKITPTSDLSVTLPESSQAYCAASVEPTDLSAVSQAASKEEKPSGTEMQEPVASTSSHQGRQRMATSWNNPFVCPPLDNEEAWPKLS